MPMQFDTEQTKAIHALGKNILVFASAGAGKTGVLVARLMKRCVDDRIDLHRILALTFTEAAAEEMKNRLSFALHEKFLSSTDAEEKAYLQSQILALEDASITTIDSYCLSIIQKYYNVIGLDIAITKNILEEGSKKALQKKCFYQALQEFEITHHDDLLHLLEMTSVRSEDYDTLYDSIQSINNTAQACVDPDAWYAKAAQSYAPIQSMQDFDPEMVRLFFSSLLADTQELQLILNEMKRVIQYDEKITEDSFVPFENALANCIDAIERESYVQYCNALDALALSTTPAQGKNETYKKIRDRLTRRLKTLLENRYPETLLIHDHNALSKPTELLIQLAKRVNDLFQEEKKIQQCMDFTDMERFAYNILLKNNEEVANTFRTSLDEIMVDEFQDTSSLQNIIITLISNGHNVFRVGDVKQSIYRFRQAKPSLMRDMMHDTNTEQIALRHNYRSKQSIVSFSNLLFDKLMNVDGIEDAYRDEDVVSIGRTEQEESSITPITLALLEQQKKKKEEEENQSLDDTETESAKLQKAGWIAQQILRMKKEDPKVSFKDFAILMKSHQDKIVMKRKFDEYHIPYDIDAREGFYQSDLAQTIMSITQVLLSDDNDIALLSVLSSPLYRWSDADFAQTKIQYQSIRKGVLEAHPEILSDLNYLKEVAYEKGALAYLRALSSLHNFYDALDSHEQANFDYLYQKTINANIVYLHDFLEMIENGKEDKSSEAINRSKDDDFVTVTTIHQSKGLQYRYVFLWGTDSNRFMDGGSQVLASDQYGIGLSFFDTTTRFKRKTLVRNAIEYHTNKEDIEEFTRLLYVAVTRAEEKLFIIDTIEKDEQIHTQPISLGLLRQRKGLTGLLTNALEPQALFQIEYVSLQDEEKAERLPTDYVNELTRFDQEIPILKRIETPSEKEVTSLPNLSLQDSDYGTQYGTYMHSIVEQLPNKVWTKNDLAPFDLSDAQSKHLLAFSSSSLYQKALQYEIYKEYPFYIQDKQERMMGTMDFVAIGEDEIILIDFKTDHATCDIIKARYKDQLDAYTNALRKMYPKHTIHTYAYSFHNDEAIAF